MYSLNILRTASWNFDRSTSLRITALSSLVQKKEIQIARWRYNTSDPFTAIIYLEWRATRIHDLFTKQHFILNAFTNKVLKYT